MSEHTAKNPDETDDDEPLMLECWNCGAETPSGTLGHIVDENQRVAAETCATCGFEFRTPPLGFTDFDELLWKPEDYPQKPISREEVRRRLPAVGFIADPDIREEVVRLSTEAPAYFWRAPAARPTSDYHHPLCRETHGLWAHTLMLTPIIERQAESLIEQTSKEFTTVDRDRALAAALLHDQRKRGPHGSRETSAVPDHDEQMAEVIRDESSLSDVVARAVASHMGPEEWGYSGPEPATALQNLVHTADMLASTANIDPRIPGPVPEELAELGLEEAPQL